MALLVLSLPEVMEEPATGNAFAVMAWNDLTVSGLPNGFTLSNAPTGMDPGTQVCLTYGTPVEGMFDVLVSGELVLSVFGQPYPVRALLKHGAHADYAQCVRHCGLHGVSNATNYLSYATIESGTCTFEGCMDPEAINSKLSPCPTTAPAIMMRAPQLAPAMSTVMARWGPVICSQCWPPLGWCVSEASEKGKRRV